MTTYNPDYWLIVEFDSPEYGKIQKVFATWSGGYLDGTSWKLSSGNKEVTVDGDYYIVPQDSGSVYRLHKEAKGVHWSWEYLLKDFQKAADAGNAKFRQVEIEELL